MKAPAYKAREMAEELLHSYCDTLHYYSLALEHVHADPPPTGPLFDVVFDLMGVPSRDELLHLRFPRPGRPNDYWTRDELVKEFHRLYDEPSVSDEVFIPAFLDFLTTLNPEGRASGSPDSIAQA